MLVVSLMSRSISEQLNWAGPQLGAGKLPHGLNNKFTATPLLPRASNMEPPTLSHRTPNRSVVPVSTGRNFFYFGKLIVYVFLH
jgi:hypothetical protein